MQDLDLLLKNYCSISGQIDRDAVYYSTERKNSYQSLRPIMDNIEDNKGVYIPVEQKQEEKQPILKIEENIKAVIDSFGTWAKPTLKGWAKTKRYLSSIYNGVCYYKEINNKVVFATPKGFVVGDIKISSSKKVYNNVSVNYDSDDNINVSGGEYTLHGGKKYYNNFYLFKN